MLRIVLLAGIYFVANILAEYPVCDNSEADIALEELIHENVDRLMELRRPGWGWVNTPEVVLSLQLSAAKKFFAVNETIATMDQEVQDEFDSSCIGKKALYVMAVKATCGNPRNFAGFDLVENLRNSIGTQFRYLRRRQESPSHGWYNYGLAIQALCLCNIEIPRSHIVNIIRGQDASGGFGNRKSVVDDTSQVLLALACIKDQSLPTRRRPLMTKLKTAIDKAVGFLQTSRNNELDDFWIGNKFSSPAALLALKETTDLSQSSSWFCNDIARSVSNGLWEDEPEATVAHRLPAMRGRSVLALKDGWTCLDPDSIPEGYQPQYNPEKTLDCSTLLESNGIFSFFLPSIEVQLSVKKTLGSNNSTPYDYTVLVEVEKGFTLLETMAKARCNNQFEFAVQSSSFGSFVTSVDSLEAVASQRQFWSLLDAQTGDFLSVGIDQYKPSHRDHILFKLSVY
ncbi:unnamed protein product [Clavelina lepadiformis]|uniref:Transcobalamin-like C-terminal domain-containing protein n=1 Tax=Clavelina lepadiformis TaxID=159417 RepID=A0ABP0FNM5_CLALP